MKPKRGRPKLYDEDEALSAAGAVFWAQGFSATSLDDLSVAMGMNRPSIYRAFGDKHAIYRRALAQFCAQLESAMERTLFTEPDIRIGLGNFFAEALKIYTSGLQPLGCMVMCTAPAAAASHPDVRADLQDVVRDIDAKIAVRIESAIAAKQLDGVDDAGALAQLLQAVLHSLSIRARAGQSKASLRKMARVAVDRLLPLPTGSST